MTTIGTSTPSALHASAPPSMPAGILYVPTMPALGINDLMQYLSGYMENSDADLRSKMAALKQSKDASAELGKISERLTELAGKAAGGADRDPADVKELRDLMATHPDLMKALSPDALKAFQDLAAAAHVDDEWTMTTPTGSKPVAAGSYVDEVGWIHSPDGSYVLGDKGELVTGTVTHEEKASVSKDAIDAAVKVVAQELATNSSSNELEMIKLQSAISARGNMLSMVSNMVKSFDDGGKSIIGNMR